MLDGISAVVEGVDVEALLQNPLLTWGRWTREDDGMPLSSSYTARHRGLIFTLFDSGRLCIRGSVHRFFNHGALNSSTFKFSDLTKAINELCGLIGVQPGQVVVQKFEIGMNIPTGSKSAKDIVESALVFKNKEFKHYFEHTCQSGKHAVFTDFEVKFYKKSSHLVRYEIASKRNRYFAKFRVRTFGDFFDRKIYHSLLFFLKESVKKVIFFESGTSPSFSESERWTYSNPQYWLTLDSYHRKTELLKYLNIIKQAGIHYTGDLLYLRMNQIGDTLLEIRSENSHFSTLGLPWKNAKIANLSSAEHFVGTSFLDACCHGRAAVSGRNQASRGRTERLRRIRSPPSVQTIRCTTGGHDVQRTMSFLPSVAFGRDLTYRFVVPL